MDQGWTDHFAERGPWTTRFWIDGEAQGGNYDPTEDRRLRLFRKLFPKPGRVLDLGCLEGGHSVELAGFSEEVVGVDARVENLNRARWISDLLRVDNVSYLEADLETFDFAGLGSFDVAFNVGLLYHLREPWNLLTHLAERSRAMFLWTHVAPTDAITVESGGYRGIFYSEFGRSDPLSGLQGESFWPTLAELRRMLRDCGFDSQKLLDIEIHHPNGPAVTLAVRVTSRPRFSWPWRSQGKKPRELAVGKS